MLCYDSMAPYVAVHEWGLDDQTVQILTRLRQDLCCQGTHLLLKCMLRFYIAQIVRKPFLRWS